MDDKAQKVITDEELARLAPLVKKYDDADLAFQKEQDFLNKLRFYRNDFEHYAEYRQVEPTCRVTSFDHIDVRICYKKIPTGFKVSGMDVSYNEICKMIGDEKRKVSKLNSEADKAKSAMHECIITIMQNHPEEKLFYYTIKDAARKYIIKQRSITERKVEIAKLEATLQTLKQSLKKALGEE